MMRVANYSPGSSLNCHTIFIAFLTNIIFCICYMTGYDVNIANNPKFSLQILGAFIGNSFLYEYYFILSIITSKIENINRIILGIQSSILEDENPRIVVGTRKSLNNSNRNRVMDLTSIRQIMKRLQAITITVEQIFSFPMLCLLPFYCSCLIYSIYTVVIILINPWQDQSIKIIILSVTCTTWMILPLIMLVRQVDVFNSKVRLF